MSGKLSLRAQVMLKSHSDVNLPRQVRSSSDTNSIVKHSNWLGTECKLSYDWDTYIWILIKQAMIEFQKNNEDESLIRDPKVRGGMRYELQELQHTPANSL